ncbi:MAG: hypothetical protein HRU31_10170 [Rhodobacteraceae bacterium]|nr:hypothetical protein [Paracoccaceae bacterium]
MHNFYSEGGSEGAGTGGGGGGVNFDQVALDVTFASKGNVSRTRHSKKPIGPTNFAAKPEIGY